MTKEFRVPYVVRDPGGTVEGRNVTEYLFSRPLTDKEQEDVQAFLNVSVEVVDWRDEQTLWVWESEKDLNDWLDYLGRL